MSIATSVIRRSISVVPCRWFSFHFFNSRKRNEEREAKGIIG